MILDERSFTLVVHERLPEPLVARLLLVWQQRLDFHIGELEKELQAVAGPGIQVERND